MEVSNTNNITIETIEEATPDDYLDDLILNTIKSIQNIKKHPGCFNIYDYLKKSLSESECTEDISDRLNCLTTNDTNKPTNETLTSLYMKDLYKTKIHLILLLN